MPVTGIDDAQSGAMWKTAALVLAAILVSSCSDRCENTVLADVAAPNGRFKAVVFQRDCGATTGHSTQVSLLRSDDHPQGAGNVFVADTDHGAAEASAGGGPSVEVVWLSDEALLVKYDARARVFTHQVEVAGVAIRYQPVERGVVEEDRGGQPGMQ